MMNDEERRRDKEDYLHRFAKPSRGTVSHGRFFIKTLSFSS